MRVLRQLFSLPLVETTKFFVNMSVIKCVETYDDVLVFYFRVENRGFLRVLFKYVSSFYTIPFNCTHKSKCRNLFMNLTRFEFIIS